MNAHGPLVSVIMPVYNAEEYIGETIESVISQTYTNWELIIVDDCSKDSSRDIARQYVEHDNRIKLIESDTNFGGPARPRNVGIKNAGGGYIAFLDSDDVWMPAKLEKQIVFMKSHNLNFSSTKAYHISVSSKPFRGKICSRILDLLYEKRISSAPKSINVIFRNPIILSSIIVEKKHLVIFFFDEDPLLVATEDQYFCLKLLNDQKTSYKLLPEKFVKYRQIKKSIVHRDNYILRRIRRDYCMTKYMAITNNPKEIVAYYMWILLSFPSILLKMASYYFRKEQ